MEMSTFWRVVLGDLAAMSAGVVTFLSLDAPLRIARRCSDSATIEILWHLRKTVGVVAIPTLILIWGLVGWRQFGNFLIEDGRGMAFMVGALPAWALTSRFVTKRAP